MDEYEGIKIGDRFPADVNCRIYTVVGFSSLSPKYPVIAEGNIRGKVKQKKFGIDYVKKMRLSRREER